MRKISTTICLLYLTNLALAQTGTDDQKNIVISKCTREFDFVKGNSAHPVQIKEESRRVYTSKSYRADVQIAEFYNEVETIDDVDIRVDESKKHGISPKFDYYNADGVFYSDARVCYFELPLLKKGSTSEVVFKKTTLDPRYFTNIFFMDDQEIEDEQIKLVVPEWMQLEIKEFNFQPYSIQKNITRGSNETVYTFDIKNIPALRHESYAPGITYYAPHILVLCKSAMVGNETYTYFKTVKEQYEWYKTLVTQVGDDETTIRGKTEEIVAGLKTDEEKVKKTFQWVQDNIRYIAFENGIAGFKPEKAQEVLRKKYGDCKGMANLLTDMLRSLHLDARRGWIGTRQIAYDYSTPSLSVDNHMICVWMDKGKPVYLDATEKYIGFGEIAERIQGREVLIEDGNQYILQKVPSATHLQNTAAEYRRFTMEGNNLKGHVVQTWKGENKEWLLSALSQIKQDKQENALKQFLAEQKPNFIINNLKINNLNDYNADLKVEYDVEWKEAATNFDKETYLDIDNRRNLESYKIDTVQRTLPYWFPFKNHLVFETEISVPPGNTVSALPQNLMIRQSDYSFNGSYSFTGGKIIYKNEIILDQTELKPTDFSKWNKDIQRLNDFYNEQIVLTKTK